VTQATLHIVFNPSGAATLRDALRQGGRSDRVVSLFDCLCFGPINPPDPELRRAWVERELEYTAWEEVTGEATSFWTDVLSPGHRRVAWLSRRSAQEYAGFLELLWRIGEKPIDVVDLTDVMVTGYEKGPTKPHLAISLALLPARQILENDLLGLARALAPASRAEYLELWRRLRQENAPLRVLSQDRLVSSPITFFDSLLLSHVKPEWQKAAMVVAKALTDFWDTSVLQTGDLVLAARLRALADEGRLESQGDLHHIRHSEVRLPSGRI
jgi:hypothetical protein